MKPRVISLFSGVGTFDYGFQLAGWETVYLCEWDAKAREVLSHRFPGVLLTNDVRDINGAELPDAECIMFGSPCQDLSVAGKRAGLAGEKSSLFLEAIRIIHEKREATNGEFPRFALWENVCGAFSSHGGKDFVAVLTALAGGEVGVPSDGWADAGIAFGATAQVAWRVLDSQHFGVPQRRRRIFALADFAGECAGAVLFEQKSVPGDSEQGGAPGQGAAGSAGQGAERDGWPARVAPTLGASWGRKWGNDQDFFSQNGGMYVPQVARCQTTRNQRQDAETENLIPVLAATLTTEEGQRSPRGDGADNLIPVLAFDCKVGAALGISVSENVSPTLLSGNVENGDRGRVAVAFDWKASVQHEPMCGPISPTLEAQDKAAIVYKYGEGQSQRIQVNPRISTTLGIAGGDAGGGGQKAAGLYSLPPTFRVRRLTPTECERLQFMPDNWTDVNGMADSHRYRFMGNGGTSLVLKWLAERIRVWL